MKTLAILGAILALTSCGIPVAIKGTFTDPETGLSVGGSYSSKSGIEVEVAK